VFIRVHPWFPLFSFLFPLSGLKVLVIEYWNLRFIWNLVLGIWDLKKIVNGCEKHYPWSD